DPSDATRSRRLCQAHINRYLILTAATISILALLIFTATVSAQTTRPAKKLIEFGWDEPDTAFLRKHIATMEQTPFDGTVFHLPGDFLGQCWGKRRFTQAELQPAM